MVPLTPVPSEFAGRVLVAKLGSAGILAELRGVSRVYPSVLDDPTVWVEAAEWSEARELISVEVDDELEADAEADPEPALSWRATAHPAWRPAAAPAWGPAAPAAERRSIRPLIAVVAVVVMASFVLGMRSCGTTASPPSSSHLTR